MAGWVRFAVALVLVGLVACPALATARKLSPTEVQLLTGDADARIAAAKKLAIEKDPATSETLIAALMDDQPLVKRFAIYGLQRIGDPAAATLIAPLVKDRDSWVRRTAIKALGTLGSKSSVPLLAEALKDDDLLVRVSAFVALGVIGDPGSEKAMIEAAEEPRLWTELRNGDQVLILESFAPPSFTDPSLRKLLVRLLDYGRMPHPEFEKLTDLQRQNDILEISNQAARLLAERFHDPSGEAWLIKGVENWDEDGMAQASIKALGTLKSRKGTAAIVKQLERAWGPPRDVFFNTLRYCIEALAQIGDPASAAPLEKFLKHPDYRLRRCAAEALEKMDGRKRQVAPDGPAAVIPTIAQKDLGTPGGRRPPQFIVLAVDDCANLEGVEALLDICQTLKAQGSKAVFTLYLAPLIGQQSSSGDAQTDDLEKKKVIYQALFDMGCEIAHHTLHHNPSWMSLPQDEVIQEIEGCTQWDRDNIVGFTRPFSFKSPGGVRTGTADVEFARDLLALQDFIYGGGRGGHPNDQMWPKPGQWPMRIPTGSLDSNAPPVHATITDPIVSDYFGRFDFDVADGVAMWKANFDYHYHHPRRPILAVNAFHDWAMRHLNDPHNWSGKRNVNRNESKILKAFLLDVLVKNKDKYPDTYCVTFRQIVEYVNTHGDLKQTLAIGNGQDSRNPVKPSVQ